MFTLYQGGIMDGSFEYMDEYVRTNHIDLTDIESVTVTVNTRDYYISSCQMYDANKNYISHEELEGDDIQSYTFNTSDYSDVKFIAFDFFNNEWSNFEPSEISVDFSVTSNEIIPTLIVAQYKFNKSIDTLPVFNSDLDYTVDDIDNNDGTITRTISSTDKPTSVSFMNCTGLIECGYVALDNVNFLTSAFQGCSSLRVIDSTEWNVSNIYAMDMTFYGCSSLVDIIGIEDWDVSDLGADGGSRSIVAVFADCTSLTKLDLSKWVVNNYACGNSTFTGCSNLTELHLPQFTGEVNILGMFLGCTSLTEVHGLENIKVLNASSNRRTFEGCSSLKTVKMSNLDASKATKLDTMFSGCTSLESVDFSNAKLSNTTDFSNMFKNCNSLTTVTLKKSSYSVVNKIIAVLPDRTSSSTGTFKITGVDDISQVDIDTTTANSKNWNIDTQYEIIAHYKFDNTIYDLIPAFNIEFTNYTYEDEVEGNVTTRIIYSEELPTKIIFGIGNGHDPEATDREKSLLEVDYVNIDNIVDISYMFNWCTNVTKIDVSNWNTSNVISAYCLFRFCVSLTSLDVSGWDTSNMTNIADMFQECQSLTTIGDVSKWNTSKVTTMVYLFTNCFVLNDIDVSNWDTSNVTNMTYMFIECRQLTSLDVSRWDVSKVTNMSYMFYGCSHLVSLDVSKWNTSKVTDMSYMFYNCKLLTPLDVSNFNTSQVTTMKYMFYYCESITTLDVSKWDISNVINIGGIFECCHSLISIDVSKWDTSNVKLAWYVFTQCWELKELDLSNWDTSNVTDMGHMFHNCNKLVSLDVSNFDTSNVTDMSSMFGYCTKLKNLNISNFNMVNVINVTDMFIRTDVLDNILMSNSDYNSVNKVISQLQSSETKKVIYAFNCNNVNLLDKGTANGKNWDICIRGGQIIDVRGNSNKYKNIKIGNARVKRIHIGEIYL